MTQPQQIVTDAFGNYIAMGGSPFDYSPMVNQLPYASSPNAAINANIQQVAMDYDRSFFSTPTTQASLNQLYQNTPSGAWGMLQPPPGGQPTTSSYDYDPYRITEYQQGQLALGNRGATLEEAKFEYLKSQDEVQNALAQGNLALAREKQERADYWQGISVQLDRERMAQSARSQELDYSARMAAVAAQSAAADAQYKVGMAGARNDAERNAITARWNAEQARIAKMEDETRRILGGQQNQTGQFGAETQRAASMGNLALETNKFLLEKASSPRDLFGLYFMQRGITPDWDALKAGNPQQGEAIVPVNPMTAYVPTTQAPVFNGTPTNSMFDQVGQITGGAVSGGRTKQQRSGPRGNRGAPAPTSAAPAPAPAPAATTPPAMAMGGWTKGDSFGRFIAGDSLTGRPNEEMIQLSPGASARVVPLDPAHRQMAQQALSMPRFALGTGDMGSFSNTSQAAPAQQMTQSNPQYMPTPSSQSGYSGSMPMALPGMGQQRQQQSQQPAQTVLGGPTAQQSQRQSPWMQRFGSFMNPQPRPRPGVPQPPPAVEEPRRIISDGPGNGYLPPTDRSPDDDSRGDGSGGNRGNDPSRYGSGFGNFMGTGGTEWLQRIREAQARRAASPVRVTSPAPAPAPPTGAALNNALYGNPMGAMTVGPNYVSPWKPNPTPPPAQPDNPPVTQINYGKLNPNDLNIMPGQVNTLYSGSDWQNPTAVYRILPNGSLERIDSFTTSQAGVPQFALGTDVSQQYANTGMGSLYMQSSNNQHLQGMNLPENMKMLADSGAPIAPGLAASMTGNRIPGLNMGKVFNQRGIGVMPSMQSLSRMTPGEVEMTKGYVQGVGGVPFSDFLDFLAKPTQNLQQAQRARMA